MMNENDIVGIPAIDDLKSYDVYQGYDDTCAIRSQQLVLKSFGIDVMQEQLMAEARDHGWYVEHGTQPRDVGNLLELHGVGVTRYRDATITDLTKALAEGKKVIVGVDARELLGYEPLDPSDSDYTANHALIVAGVDTANPDDVRVILTDPGTGDVAKSYPIDTFNAVWHDSHNMMIVTNDPVPDLPNFDSEAGHITGSIAGLSYDDWCEQHGDEFSNAYQIGCDSNVDGVIDTWFEDVDHNGTFDVCRIDTDGDGVADMEGEIEIA